MTIELSKPEIELLEQALVTWENEAMQSSFTGAVLGAIFGKENREKEFKTQMETAQAESQKRRMKSVMLRAKLAQALTRDTEHMIET